MYLLQSVIILTVYLATARCNKNNGSLQLLHIFFRHGERSPRETYTNDPFINYNWPGGLGQLSNNGKVEMYELGLILRKQYEKFLPPYYYPNDVSVLSSYADRCIMSAELLLAGLYPPKGEQIWNEDLLWQPIPVTSIPRDLDNIIAMKRKCDKYDRALEQAYKSDKMKQINEANKDLYDYLTVQTGDLINNIGAVEILHNTLEIEEINNLTLPAWTKEVYPKKLRPLAALNLAIHTDTTFMKRMKGGVFLKEIIQHMKDKRDNKLKPNRLLYLYSGHDISVVNILRTLGFDDLIKPGFGCSLIFEQHTDEIKIIYRDDVHQNPLELQLKNCPKPCTLDGFAKALELVLPNNWEKECLLA